MGAYESEYHRDEEDDSDKLGSSHSMVLPLPRYLQVHAGPDGGDDGLQVLCFQIYNRPFGSEECWIRRWLRYCLNLNGVGTAPPKQSPGNTPVIGAVLGWNALILWWKCNHYWQISQLLTDTKENESYADIVLDQRCSVAAPYFSGLKSPSLFEVMQMHKDGELKEILPKGSE